MSNHSLSRFRVISFSLILSLILGFGGAANAGTATRSILHVPVLMYHMIDCARKSGLYRQLWVCPEVFDKTLSLLKAGGWETITSENLSLALEQGTPVPPKSFVITIDDGNRNGYDNAYPILEKYDYEAVFAVVVGRVQARETSMTWAELKELLKNGHEIANHSMSHVDLRRQTAAGLKYEIEISSQTLDEHLGHRPMTFVYPYGYWNQKVVSQVKLSGFRIAYTTIYGARQKYSTRFTSPRIRVNRSDTPERVLAKVNSYI